MEVLQQYIESFHWLEVLDIALVLFFVYQLYQLVKGTIAIRIFIGIFGVYIFWKLTQFLKMTLLSEILGQFIGVGVIALIIVFQQELRRFLLLIGTKGFKNIPVAKRVFRLRKTNVDLDVDSIVNACQSMSRTKTGALIVLQKETDIMLYISNFDLIEAKLSTRLLESIFVKNSPLHDGALIIINNKIHAVRCVLPVLDDLDFPDYLGMRHRAAAGITRETDAIAIIVSEQTGEIAYSKQGKVHTFISSNYLRELLTIEFI